MIKMTNDTLDFVTQKLLDQAKLMGADEADVIATKGQSLNVDVRQGALENADRAEGTEVGLRVLVSKRQAIVSSSDISEDTLQLMVERAIAMAKDAPEDKYAGLANVDQLTKETDLFGLEICDPAPEPSPSKLRCQMLQHLMENILFLWLPVMVLLLTMKDQATRFPALRLPVKAQIWNVIMMRTPEFINLI